jgi:hypothetical protein
MHEKADVKDNSNSELSTKIKAAQLQISRVILLSTAIVVIPTLVASLYRITTIGWQPVMAIHILLAVCLWLIAAFRNVINYQIQGGFLVFLFLVVGLSGIYQFGLVAPSVAFLIAASPLAVLFFGKKAGIASLLTGLGGAVIIGILTTTGDLTHQVNIVDYVIAPESWYIAIFCWALASIVLVASLSAFNRNLIEALTIAEQRQVQVLFANRNLDQSNENLQNALDEIKTLQGIIPICSWCHSIRDDRGAWNHLETYLSNHSEAEFSHGMCPDCDLKISKELDEKGS